MDMQQIGYFLYMEEQERKQQEEQQKVNAEKNPDLVGEEATTNEEEKRKNIFSEIYRPYRRTVDILQAAAASLKILSSCIARNDLELYRGYFYTVTH